MQVAEGFPRTRGFGVFEADLRAAELRKHGIRIKLQEQPFQILSLLLEHPGEVVTREELRQKLWPAHTFVDFDRSLNKAMTKLRAALGDSADSPRYVETIPRHGYRFLAPVHAHYQEPVSTTPAESQNEEVRKKIEPKIVERASAKSRFLPHFVSFQGSARWKISLLVVAPIPYSPRRGPATAGNDDLSHHLAPRRPFVSPHAGERAPSPGSPPRSERCRRFPCAVSATREVNRGSMQRP